MSYKSDWRWYIFQLSVAINNCNTRVLQTIYFFYQHTFSLRRRLVYLNSFIFCLKHHTGYEQHTIVGLSCSSLPVMPSCFCFCTFLCRYAGRSLTKLLKRWPSLISNCVLTLTGNLRDLKAPEHVVLGSCSILSSQTVLRHLTTVCVFRYLYALDLS
jgi:hypothetical protein